MKAERKHNIYANQQESFTNDRNILVEVAPREGRTKPGENSIDEALPVLCNCKGSNKIKLTVKKKKKKKPNYKKETDNIHALKIR